MKLNAGIIYEHLRTRFDVELHGDPGDRLHLSRPLFYMEEQTVFESDSLYLASADHLPTRPIIKCGAVIVCIGESLQLRRYLRQCTVLQVKGHPDFFSVYLAIQQAFEVYDTWNDELFDLFKQDADVNRIVSLSADCLGLPLIVIDGSFRVLAASRQTELPSARRWKDERENLSQYSLRNFLSVNALHTDDHGPMLLKSVETNSLCVNLFDASGRYIGCLCAILDTDDPHAGLSALVVYLAHVIEAAILKNPSLLVSEHGARKGALRDLVEGKPLGTNLRRLLDPISENPRYACVSIHTFAHEQALPSSFICNSFESAFPNGYAFPIGQMVVGIVDLSDADTETADLRDCIDPTLSSLVDALRLKAGVSFDYSDLNESPVYVQQAEAALVDGSIMDPKATHHYFEDYALTELVVNAISGAPIESLFPRELRRVVEHDRTSAISYLETLRVFLNENMNYSKVATLLYVHRSTLVDRINKIEHNYGLDLHDPDTRLYLQLILKAMDVEKAIKENG